jgi:hypothetical protein
METVQYKGITIVWECLLGWLHVCCLFWKWQLFNIVYTLVREYMQFLYSVIYYNSWFNEHLGGFVVGTFPGVRIQMRTTCNFTILPLWQIKVTTSIITMVTTTIFFKKFKKCCHLGTTFTLQEAVVPNKGTFISHEWKITNHN